VIHADVADVVVAEVAADVELERHRL